MASFHIVVARLEDQYSIDVFDRDIGTWCKFRVLSTLSAPRTTGAGESLSTFPGELRSDRFLPLQPDDLLVHRGGGTLVIDGVEVVQRDSTFRAFRVGETYLLFLQRSDDAARVAMHSDGAYVLSGPDAFIPIARSGSRVQKELEELTGGSLVRFREAMKSGGYDR